MLQALSAHIKNCLEQAENAKRRAAETADPRMVADFLRLEQSWTRLAESFQWSERLERFLLKRGNEALGGWAPISSAPFDCELELAVVEKDEPHALVFPCRRILGGWIKAENQEKLIGFQPTHWREWQGVC